METTQLAMLFGYPEPVYRGFDKSDHAHAFGAGVVRLSTLERCRKIEDAKRRDAGEATFTYHLTELLTDTGPHARSRTDIAEILSRVSIAVEGGSNFEFAPGIAGEKYVPDAHLVCFSASPKAAAGFGRFVVRVNDPSLFAELVGLQLPLLGREWSCDVRKVTYQERYGPASDDAPAPIWFIKPPFFEAEQEVRAIYVPLNFSDPLPEDRTVTIDPPPGLIERIWS